MRMILIIISSIIITMGITGICKATDYVEKKDMDKKFRMNFISSILGSLGFAVFMITITCL